MKCLLLALLASCAVDATSPTSDPEPEDESGRDASVADDPERDAADDVPGDDARFDALVDAVRADLAAAEGATACSVAVWIDGQVVWVGGFGEVPGTGLAPGEDTVFMIGSDTKKITALSLLRRVDEGLATLETTVAEVLPELAMPWAPDFPAATIRDLLSNQGGIVDGTHVDTTTTDDVLEAFALGEFSESFYEMAPPGRIWNYANPNFSIAGLMDQRLDGRMWADIVEEDLFGPLGMTRTFARKSEVDDDHAPGYGPSGEAGDTTDGPVTLAETWESAFSRPAGLVWSTPSDQMRLAAFLVDGDPGVLSPALLGEVSAEQTMTYPELTSAYGFGLAVDPGLVVGDEYYAVPLWSHGGDTLTHSSTFYVLPEQRFAISILSNSGSDDFTGSVVTAIATLAGLPAPSPMPEEAAFDPAALDALTGTYVDEYNLGSIVVTRAGDALELSMPDLDDAGIAYGRRMDAITTRVWLADIEGEELDFAFIDGPDGETYFRNRAFVAIRAPR